MINRVLFNSGESTCLSVTNPQNSVVKTVPIELILNGINSSRFTDEQKEDEVATILSLGDCVVDSLQKLLEIEKPDRSYSIEDFGLQILFQYDRENNSLKAQISGQKPIVQEFENPTLKYFNSIQILSKQDISFCDFKLALEKTKLSLTAIYSQMSSSEKLQFIKNLEKHGSDCIDNLLPQLSSLLAHQEIQAPVKLFFHLVRGKIEAESNLENIPESTFKELQKIVESIPKGQISMWEKCLDLFISRLHSIPNESLRCFLKTLSEKLTSYYSTYNPKISPIEIDCNASWMDIFRTYTDLATIGEIPLSIEKNDVFLVEAQNQISNLSTGDRKILRKILTDRISYWLCNLKTGGEEREEIPYKLFALLCKISHRLNDQEFLLFRSLLEHLERQPIEKQVDLMRVFFGASTSIEVLKLLAKNLETVKGTPVKNDWIVQLFLHTNIKRSTIFKLLDETSIPKILEKLKNSFNSFDKIQFFKEIFDKKLVLERPDLCLSLEDLNEFYCALSEKNELTVHYLGFLASILLELQYSGGGTEKFMMKILSSEVAEEWKQKIAKHWILEIGSPKSGPIASELSDSLAEQELMKSMKEFLFLDPVEFSHHLSLEKGFDELAKNLEKDIRSIQSLNRQWKKDIQGVYEFYTNNLLGVLITGILIAYLVDHSESLDFEFDPELSKNLSLLKSPSGKVNFYISSVLMYFFQILPYYFTKNLVEYGVSTCEKTFHFRRPKGFTKYFETILVNLLYDYFLKEISHLEMSSMNRCALNILNKKIFFVYYVHRLFFSCLRCMDQQSKKVDGLLKLVDEFK